MTGGIRRLVDWWRDQWTYCGEMEKVGGRFTEGGGGNVSKAESDNLMECFPFIFVVVQSCRAKADLRIMRLTL